MKVIGITGGIGSGKSIICSVIEKIGFPVFYSDKEAKEILVSDEEVINKLTSLIGEDLYRDGVFHKEILANKIFKEPSIKEKVNSIIHPRVRERFSQWADTQNSSLVFNEAAILFETGMYKNYDATVLFTAPEPIRIYRAMKIDQTSKEAIEDRIKNQWSDEQKKKLADHIILNDDETPVMPQLEKVLLSLNINL